MCAARMRRACSLARIVQSAGSSRSAAAPLRRPALGLSRTGACARRALHRPAAHVLCCAVAVRTLNLSAVRPPPTFCRARLSPVLDVHMRRRKPRALHSASSSWAAQAQAEPTTTVEAQQAEEVVTGEDASTSNWYPPEHLKQQLSNVDLSPSLVVLANLMDQGPKNRAQLWDDLSHLGIYRSRTHLKKLLHALKKSGRVIVLNPVREGLVEAPESKQAAQQELEEELEEEEEEEDVPEWLRKDNVKGKERRRQMKALRRKRKKKAAVVEEVYHNYVYAANPEWRPPARVLRSKPEAFGMTLEQIEELYGPPVPGARPGVAAAEPAQQQQA